MRQRDIRWLAPLAGRVAWSLIEMDDLIRAIKALTRGCALVGIHPTTPFAALKDFHATMFEFFPRNDVKNTNRQLRLVLEAITMAQKNNAEGVAVCIRQIAALR